MSAETPPPPVALTEADYRDILTLIDLAVKGQGLALDLAHVQAVAKKVQAVATQDAAE